MSYQEEHCDKREPHAPHVFMLSRDKTVQAYRWRQCPGVVEKEVLPDRVCDQNAIHSPHLHKHDGVSYWCPGVKEAQPLFARPDELLPGWDDSGETFTIRPNETFSMISSGKSLAIRQPFTAGSEPIICAVLGSSRNGIGEATARRLRKDGHDVAEADRDTFDVRRAGKLAAWLRDINPTHVVWAVGVNKLAWIKDFSPIDFSELMDINVGAFISALNVMLEHSDKPRSVVAVSSDAAVRPMRTSISYCASKAALDMAVRVAARELGPMGWRVNAVSPGKVSGTAMTDYVDNTVPALRGWTPEYAASYERSTWVDGQPVTPDEVAEVICSTLLSDAKHLNGAIIPVNGGR